MNSIIIHSSLISAATLSFIQGYNTGEVKSASIEAINTSNLQAIGLYQIPGQLTTVLASATFLTPQVKQTFKISLQRYFAKVFTGKALTIKGNTVSVSIVAVGQVVDFKGRITTAPTADDVAKAKADKEAKKQLLLDAEQTTIRLEKEEQARKHAESVAAELVKKQAKVDDDMAEEKSKAKIALDILSARVVELERQLEYAKHETVGTVKVYQELKAMIMGKTTIQALRAKVSGVTVFQPMTGAERQSVIMECIAAQA